MQFSSRPPISRDRYPYRNKYDGSRWTDPGVDTRGNTVVYDPRPEKGVHPQTNPTNPILVEFRAIWGGQPDMLEHAEFWVDEKLDGDWESEWTHESTAEQREHARSVLTRLANLAKEPT